MEGVVPSQITPLQNCPRQYHPQHLKKKKYYFYYYQIDGGDFAIGRSNLHSNVWLDRPLYKVLHLFFDGYANTANSFRCYHIGYRDWKFLKDGNRRIS